MAGSVDLCVVGEGLSGEGFSPEDPPPWFLQVEPARPDRDERVLDPRMVLEPFAGGFSVVTGQVVGDDVDVTGRIGLFDQFEEALVVDAVAGGRGERDGVAVADADRSVDPDLVRAARVFQCRLDPVPIDRPPWRWSESSG